MYENNETGEYEFIGKEMEIGQSFVSFEPVGERIQFLEDKIIQFWLKEGSTEDEAREVAKFLNSKIEAISMSY